jgi:hypothetical protein
VDLSGEQKESVSFQEIAKLYRKALGSEEVEDFLRKISGGYREKDITKLNPKAAKALSSEEVEDFLRKMPGYRTEEFHRSKFYVISRTHGFQLLFRRIPGKQAKKAGRVRVLTTAFLFPDDTNTDHLPTWVHRFRKFKDLPFGLNFSDTDEQMKAKFGEPFQKAVKESTKRSMVEWHAWRVGGFVVEVQFDEYCSAVTHFAISIPEILEDKPSRTEEEMLIRRFQSPLIEPSW